MESTKVEVSGEKHKTLKEKRAKKATREEHYSVKDGQCPFELPKKKRPCKQAYFKRPNGTKSNYCRFHAHLDTPDIKFVPCPYEKDNAMPDYMLADHLKVCPKLLHVTKIENKSFFNKGLNFMHPQNKTLHE